MCYLPLLVYAVLGIIPTHARQVLDQLSYVSSEALSLGVTILASENDQMGGLCISPHLQTQFQQVASTVPYPEVTQGVTYIPFTGLVPAKPPLTFPPPSSWALVACGLLASAF